MFMSANGSRRNKPDGKIRIKDSHNRLQLVFTHDSKRHYISLGLSRTPLNMKLAQDKAFEVQRDIEYGEFDPTYERYKIKTAIEPAEPEPTPEPSESRPDVPELWTQYIEVRKAGKSPSTIRMYDWVANHLKRCPYKKLDAPQAIADWLSGHVPADSTKRVLTQLSACCKWAKKSGLLDTNPFEGMASDIKLKKVSNEEFEIFPFTRQERDRIITAFKQSRYYKIYAPMLEFLFLTGCRPSEVVALKWKHINDTTITFEQARVYSGRGYILKDGLKTQKARKFPINTQLALLLEAIKPERVDRERLLFPSPQGQYINWSNFTNRAWQSIMASLPEIEYRNPYQTRHTFCSLCREAGISSIQIAKWVGNSAAMIDRVYAKAVEQIQVPEL
jgi:integrase